MVLKNLYNWGSHMAKTKFDSNTDFTTLSLLPLASTLLLVLFFQSCSSAGWTLQSSYWPRCKMLCQPGLEDQSGVELSWSTLESWFRLETVVNKCSSLLSSNNFVPETQKNLLSDDIFRSSEAKFGRALYTKEKGFFTEVYRTTQLQRAITT